MIDRVLHQGWPMRTAAQAAGVSVRTGYKWLARFRTEGAPGLMDALRASDGRLRGTAIVAPHTIDTIYSLDDYIVPCVRKVFPANNGKEQLDELKSKPGHYTFALWDLEYQTKRRCCGMASSCPPAPRTRK